MGDTTRLKHIAANADLTRHDIRRFEEAYGRRTGTPYTWNRPAGRLLMNLFGNSHALTERLIAHPEWSDRLRGDDIDTAATPAESFRQELSHELPSLEGTDYAAAGTILRHFKYREMVRIVSRDLAGATAVSNILREWSDCADALIAATYDLVYTHLCRTHGIPCPGCIIALGKLGGQELNYSSDVDVLFVYESDDDGGCDVTPHEFYVRLANHITRLLADVTAEGFVFRIDHELRPEGVQGTLANSLDALERYYEYFGQDWERQALIRARPIAGSVALGNSFIERMRPFVFRRTLGIDDLKAMKRLKERAIVATGVSKGIDIKHGPGGIRSVEFLVQAFQLIYGGSIEALRLTNTFDAIDALVRERLIHSTSGRRLREAYSFLRRCENMLQMVREQQRHVLPTTSEELDALARQMGYGDERMEQPAVRFNTDLNRNREHVERLFEAMFHADYERRELIEAIEDNLATCANDEEACDSIPWFKHQEVRRIQHLDVDGKLTLKEVLSRLTLVAEVVISTAQRLSWEHLSRRYGIPRVPEGDEAQFAIVGMGKLGSGEIDYGSDLDLCFIYSGEGKTDGSRSIENAEFFARLAQRIISLITTLSRYGRAYEVDSELRPSGRSGLLVSTQRAFTDYHLTRATPWEQLALLRARVVGGHAPFTGQLGLMLESLAFELPMPDQGLMRDQLRHIRMRIHHELVRESPTRFNIKHGRGGSDDLDAIIQLYLLEHVHAHPSLRTRNTFDVVDALHREALISNEDYETMSTALHFYRRLISRIRLLYNRALNEFDLDGPHAPAIAMSMGFENIAQLATELARYRKDVEALYERNTREK